MTAPKRRPRHDRILAPKTSPEEMAASYAVAPFDRRARLADQTWGADRLPELVSPETARKFGSAIGRLNAALDANDVAHVAHMAAVCIRGFDAMDAEARQLGHVPPDGRVVEAEIDGHRFGVLLDDADWPIVERTRPGLRCYTLREVSLALRDLDAKIAPVKDAFPGAEIIRIGKTRSSRSSEPPNDPIDFGLTADPETEEPF